MTGQMSIFDFPEYLPEDSDTEALAEILWENANSGVRGYISGGGDSISFIKNAYGTCGGTCFINGKADGIIHYGCQGVKINNKKIDWLTYLKLMQGYAAKKKGWDRR